MVTVARDTCLATFPSYRSLAKRLSAAGLSQDDQGIWRGPNTIVVLRKDNSAQPNCEVWMAFDSKAKDVSDHLQSKLGGLGVTILKAVRKGARLSASFRKGETLGTLKVEPFNGRTSKIVVAEGERS